MTEEARPSAGRLEAELASLARSVRRQTIATWCLCGLLVVAFGAPWLTYLLYSSRTPEDATTLSSTTGSPTLESPEPFDNDFHARPFEDQIQRATVIFLTKLEKTGDLHQERVSEIIKQKPGVRFYYKVGDLYESLSHKATAACEGCEGQGQVVFMIGNPADMVLSMGWEGERIEGMGDMPLAELRKMATASLAVPKS